MDYTPAQYAQGVEYLRIMLQEREYVLGIKDVLTMTKEALEKRDELQTQFNQLTTLQEDLKKAYDGLTKKYQDKTAKLEADFAAAEAELIVQHRKTTAVRDKELSELDGKRQSLLDYLQGINDTIDQKRSEFEGLKKQVATQEATLEKAKEKYLAYKASL